MDRVVKGGKMTQHDPKHIIDVICSIFGGSSSVACLFAFEFLPILIQILSVISLFLSISWFLYRYYKEWKK